VLEKNNKLSLMIDYYPRCMQRLDETARLVSDYKNAMHFRRRKIVFEEILLQRKREKGEKNLSWLLTSIGHNYTDFGEYMFREKMDNTAAFMLGFVAFETAYTYASTDAKRRPGPGEIKLLGAITRYFEFCAYRLVRANGIIQKDHSESLEFIIGKENQNVIEIRKPQVQKLSQNTNHIYDRWQGLKKALQKGMY